MPPKTRFSKEDIIEAAFNIVRKNGWTGLSARSIAHELNSSTQPIYSYLKSMKNIEEKVVKKALDLMYEYIITPRTGDVWLDQGIGYVMFARDEKNLFRCTYGEKYWNVRIDYGMRVWELLSEKLSDYHGFKGLSPEQAEEIRTIRWMYVYGLATLVNNTPVEIHEEKNLAEYIKNAQETINTGYRARLEFSPGNPDHGFTKLTETALRKGTNRENNRQRFG